MLANALLMRKSALLGIALSAGATVALLTAYGGSISDVRAHSITTVSTDSADCRTGAQTVSDLQPVLRQLGDSLTALGPAADRNILPTALAQLDDARRSADRISGGFAAAADAMSAPSMIRSEFRHPAAVLGRQAGALARDRRARCGAGCRADSQLRTGTGCHH
ncbi:hypothetical protein [Nocardia seriolae]|uniref:Uncharacterized protein n=1 Tax=Nocardia seriolae TaxID=37332 RepID=A0A0B8NEA5_9NOCA|nr:hypothetical protein [Nocardia seriolae]GEM25753.1 hypothetical protein NS2_39920 [Nocardia seriolae NBRC 15557]MTK32033.1 hypothetical protein [Nocardia seriolae]MTK42067.1 hypothetical protein [Nocardia seriolae]QOW35804.1 hypothetical protein IMZ23_13340 [Nocardia seriolae]QUN16704.1 hypothetical protein KEC46_31615 [Nocardia seriolae]